MTHRITQLFILLTLLLTLAAPSVTGAARVSILTCAPGNDIYELEGHTGLRIVIPEEHIDVVANWGVFDFDSPGFVYRFVKGETDYSIAITDTYLFLYPYRRAGRQVVEQQLNLTPAQVDNVLRMVDENYLPQNRVYRYNYVLDNCATRPLAIIERALGDSIALGNLPSGPDPQGATFRRAMRHYHVNYPWYQFGIDTALGGGLDKPITARKLTFAPVALRDMLATATIADSTGARIPLVTSTKTLTRGAPQGIASGPTPWYKTPLALFTAILVIAIALSISNVRRRCASRIFDTIFFAFLGLDGCILAFLVFISTHEASSPNWLLLWVNPLCLIAAVLLWIRRLRWLTSWFFLYNILAIITFAVIWLAGIQIGNIAFIPIMLTALLRSFIHLLYDSKK